MNDTPLTQAETEYLDSMLLEHGNDESILTVSELDGFFTAIASGPEIILPSVWYPTIWNGADNEPDWPTHKDREEFFALLFRHMNALITPLLIDPEGFEPLFLINTSVKTEAPVYIAEDWCFGYMRGVNLGQWPTLPAGMDRYLETIHLHASEENFDNLDTFSLAQHQQSVAKIKPAVLKLLAYWLERRTPAVAQLSRTTPKIGRNDPCFCGSGKKYKQCCLH